MKTETAIRIAALFDGEVDSAEKAELLAIMDKDPAAKAYWDSLSEVEDNLQGTHVSSIDVGAEWNKVRNQLNSSPQQNQDKVLQFPKFATAAAALVALGLGVWFPGREISTPSDLDLPGLDHSVYMVETDLENATPVVYLDEPSGWTVVWVVEQDPQDPVEG